MKKMILLMSLVLTFSLQAATLKQIKAVTNSYYLSKLLGAKAAIPSLRALPEVCPTPIPGPTTSCMDMVCKRLGSWACDEQSEINRVIQMCSTQFDGSCMESMCTRLGTWACDEFSELQNVSGLCVNNFGGACIDQVCTRLGSWACDEFSELRNVSNVCKNTNYGTMDCFKFTCERLGSWACDEFSEIQNVIKSCQGQ